MGSFLRYTVDARYVVTKSSVPWSFPKLKNNQYLDLSISQTISSSPWEFEIWSVHIIKTGISSAGNLYIPHTNTTRHGLNSIYRKSIDAWNHYIKQFKYINLSD